MPNTIIFFALYCVLVLLVACSSKDTEAPNSLAPTTQPAPIGQEETNSVLSVKVIDKKIASFSSIANQPLTTLTLTDRSKTLEVTNCQDFISNISQYSVEETTQNMQVFADYQQCVVSWLTDRAKPASHNFITNDFSTVVMDELDLSSFGSSLGPRLEENKVTLSVFSFSNVTQSANEVTINDEGWTYEFTLLAQGDFTGDGNEDLLVRFLDQSGVSSYFSLQTLLLEKTGNDSKLTAKDAVKLIKP